MKIVIKSGKETSYFLQLEDTLISFHKNVGYSLSTNFYKEPYPKNFQLGVRHETIVIQCLLSIINAIQKLLVNSFPECSPMIFAINTVTFSWKKFFVPLLTKFASNYHIIKISLEFANDIMQQNSCLFIVSLRDIDSLFTNIMSGETINISIELLFNKANIIYHLKKTQIFEMLKK